MQRLLFILDRDNDSLYPMSAYLQEQGFDVIMESDSSRGVARIAQLNPGVILMGEKMPSVNGVELLLLLRRRAKHPIIMLGEGNETSIVSSLLHGADMYVTKPVNHQELLSRVRTILRRSEAMSNGRPLDLSQSLSGDFLPQSVRASLTETEARLFACLIEKSGRVMGHEELMIRVWGKPVKKERLRFYVHSLRRKLGEAALFSLHTRNGIGYVLHHPAMQS